MILTGKAKADFERWYVGSDDKIKHTLQMDLFYSKPHIERAAYYGAWFRESAFIHIQVYPWGNKIHWCYNLSNWQKDPDLYFYDRLSSLKIRQGREDERFDSYEIAFNEAITKANQIYNETKKD
ncbi:hypothetical protein [Polluticaenibacter yanchengensis]|uniref:Uncharacterized protein n=1 Tax=Polluticaenibacter yanchengensis TaxID=3014562 RepID=A0ABT4UKI5_9BACT|nr:hypothetical protein [Chitinophagaceae bacterium LY-5]